MSEFAPTIGRWWVASAPSDHVPGYIDRDLDSTGGPWRLMVEGRLAELPEPGYDRHLTIHGDTVLGQFTLERALPSRLLGRLDDSEAQIWHGWQLIKGGHVEDGQRFRAAVFRLPHLWDWIGPVGLNYHTLGATLRSRPTPDDPGEALSAVLRDESRVTLGRNFVRTVGTTGESWEGYGVYGVHREKGVSLDELEGLTLALARLHSILSATPMGSYGVTLGLGADEAGRRLEVVDPDSPSGVEWGRGSLRDPFFDTAEIAFEPFIRAWIRLHEDATGAMAAAAPRDDRQFVTSKLIETCNGVEELAALEWDPPEASDEDTNVLTLLKAGSVSRDLRDFVGFHLRLRRWSLADKLERLAGLAGPESVAWLLGPSISEWARLVSRLRNSLAHGKKLPGGLSDDMPFVITAQFSATAVLRLALLRLAGYENPLSKAPGELLWSGGKPVVGHPNSDLFHEFETVASYSGQWKVWLDRLGD